MRHVSASQVSENSGSREQSVQSDMKTAQANEQAKIAELTAAKELLRKQQKLRLEEESLKIETELAKAKARGQVYSEAAADKGQDGMNSYLKEKGFEKPPDDDSHAEGSVDLDYGTCLSVGSHSSAPGSASRQPRPDTTRYSDKHSTGAIPLPAGGSIA